LHQLGQGNRLTPRNALDQTQVGGGEQADVVGVLAVNALKALGNHQSHTSQLFGRRAVLTRGALAIALASHHHGKAPSTHSIGADGAHIAYPKAGVGVATQCVVVMGEDGQGRDLVGGDIVAQRAYLSKGQDLTAQLPRHGGGRLGQEQQASVEWDQGGIVKHARMMGTVRGRAKRQSSTGDRSKCAILRNPEALGCPECAQRDRPRSSCGMLSLRQASITACTEGGRGVLRSAYRHSSRSAQGSASGRSTKRVVPA